MFRLLKQWRITGRLELSKEDFNELLDVPKSYRETNVNQFILRPIKEELTPLFPGLKITKRHGKGRGKPVVGYTFTFKPEAKGADDFSRGSDADRAKKLDNVHYNNNLTTDEKERTVRRILGLFEELPDWLKAERVQTEAVLTPAEVEGLEETNAKIAKAVTRVDELVAQGQKLTAGDKKTLAHLKAIHAANLEQLNSTRR